MWLFRLSIVVPFSKYFSAFWCNKDMIIACQTEDIWCRSILIDPIWFGLVWFHWHSHPPKLGGSYYIAVMTQYWVTSLLIALEQFLQKPGWYKWGLWELLSHCAGGFTEGRLLWAFGHLVGLLAASLPGKALLIISLFFRTVLFLELEHLFRNLLGSTWRPREPSFTTLQAMEQQQ